MRAYPAKILTMRSLGYFGSEKSPRVIWTGFEGDLQDLVNMADELDEAMADFGITPEHKRYHPHLTLGRAKRGADSEVVHEILAEYDGVVLGEYEVNSVVMFESLLQSGGAEHHPIRTIALK